MSQGVVCSLKENFGFIERSDVVREIFFHYSEYDGNIAELVLGDDVEFNIQTRNVSFITDFFTIQMAFWVTIDVCFPLSNTYLALLGLARLLLMAHLY